MDCHLGLGLGEGPVQAALWDLRSLDVLYRGGINILSEFSLQALSHLSGSGSQDCRLCIRVTWGS